MPTQKYVHPENPGALGFDKQLYIRLREEKQSRRLVDKFEIPPISGRAWPVPKGHLCQIVSVEGPQAGDFNVWNLNNPRERFWCARSRQINGCHVTTHSRLWSTLPYLRPILTFTDDTVPLSENGVRCHDLIGTRCDPYLFKIIEGRYVDYTCHTLLTRAVAPYHLTELDVHDVVNLFQPGHFDSVDEISAMDTVPARRGDYIEFFAEIDLLCALSTCHSGDFTTKSSQVAGGVRVRSGDATDAFATCKPLGVEVYAVDKKLLRDWMEPQPVQLESVYGPMSFPGEKRG